MDAHPVPDPLASSALGFDRACAEVVAYLKAEVPLGYWSVSRYDGERQVYLHVLDDAYGTGPGDSHAWDTSLCQHTVRGAPQVAPDVAAVPVYAAEGITRDLPIGAYVGIPLQSGEGRLFGTICGLDPRRQDPGLLMRGPLLRLLGALLTSVLQADLARDASRRAAEAALAEADTDRLTGLHNRRGWDRRLAAAAERCRRFGDPATVVVVDLDGLKQVNDSRGHAAGDELIQRTGRVLRAQLRDVDVVARLGGDEFAVLALGTAPAHAQLLVARLRAALAGAGLAASVGSAPHRLGQDVAATVQQADRAMYDDKRARRGAVPPSPGLLTAR